MSPAGARLEEIVGELTRVDMLASSERREAAVPRREAAVPRSLPLRQEGQEARGVRTPHPSPRAGTVAHRQGGAGHWLSVGAREGAGAAEGPGGGGGEAHLGGRQRPADSRGACKTQARPLTQASNLTRFPDPPWARLLGCNMHSVVGLPSRGRMGVRAKGLAGLLGCFPAEH